MSMWKGIDCSMSDWKMYMDDDNDRGIYHQKKKINKAVYCKKNKITSDKFGPHNYASNDNRCTLCGHVKKEESNT